MRQRTPHLSGGRRRVLPRRSRSAQLGDLRRQRLRLCSSAGFCRLSAGFCRFHALVQRAQDLQHAALQRSHRLAVVAAACRAAAGGRVLRAWVEAHSASLKRVCAIPTGTHQARLQRQHQTRLLRHGARQPLLRLQQLLHLVAEG
jgi:hypothetical protein